jgi:hypothetical protein
MFYEAKSSFKFPLCSKLFEYQPTTHDQKCSNFLGPPVVSTLIVGFFHLLLLQFQVFFAISFRINETVPLSRPRAKGTILITSLCLLHFSRAIKCNFPQCNLCNQNRSNLIAIIESNGTRITHQDESRKVRVDPLDGIAERGGRPIVSGMLIFSCVCVGGIDPSWGGGDSSIFVGHH